MNPYLSRNLMELNLWNETLALKLKEGNGSIGHIKEIPSDLKEIFQTVWELPGMKVLLEMAVARNQFVDQCEPFNAYMNDPNSGKLSTMIVSSWKKVRNLLMFYHKHSNHTKYHLK